MTFLGALCVKAFIVLHLSLHISTEEAMCQRKEQCTATAAEQQEIKSNLYDEESNRYTQLIAEALANYTPCTDVNCTCHAGVLKADLKPFKGGITKAMIDRAKQYGTHYQIVRGKLYRQRDCMFPARCSGVEHFIKPLLPSLPDMDLIINGRDWPQISTHWNKEKIPVLSFSKTDEYLDIMYPAWAFWEGGPAIALYPTGLGRWDHHRERITAAAERFPWAKKKAKAFFRGSRTSDERDPLVLLSREQPHLVDAQYTKNQAWKSPQDTLNADPAKEVLLEDHCRFKFLFNFRGVAASFRFKHLFLCQSLVFHVGDEWREFFYPSLVPWVHYVPVAVNSTQEELRKLIQFFAEHDELALAIATRGYEHIWNHLRMQDVKCYWRKLLKRYGKLVRYQVELNEGLISV